MSLVVYFLEHAHLCVCLSVRLSLAVFPHYSRDPDVTRRMVGGAPRVRAVVRECSEGQTYRRS